MENAGGSYIKYDGTDLKQMVLYEFEVIGMCGRYTLFTDRELKEVDDIIEKIDNDIKRYKMKTGEIFPTNIAPVILFEKEIVVPRLLTWGFQCCIWLGFIMNLKEKTDSSL